MSDTPLDAKGLDAAIHAASLAPDDNLRDPVTAAIRAYLSHSSAFTQGVEMMREADVEAVALAMERRRDELIAKPLVRIWRDLARTAAAAIRALPASDSGNVPEGQWQPIETAPRDGTEILATLRVNRHGKFDRWERHVIAADEETGELHRDYEQGWRFEDYEFWHPLPLPPSQEPGHGG